MVAVHSATEFFFVTQKHINMIDFLNQYKLQYLSGVHTRKAIFTLTKSLKMTRAS